MKTNDLLQSKVRAPRASKARMIKSQNAQNLVPEECGSGSGETVAFTTDGNKGGDTGVVWSRKEEMRGAS